MTKLIIIRHGEPDYSLVATRNFRGHGMDLAQLTPKGIEQANVVSKDKRLDGASIIVSSPYTRALQTAAIISKERSLDISIEVDIHEWLPDLTFNNRCDEEVEIAVQECIFCKGEYTDDNEKKWERLSAVANRAFKGLEKYLKYEKIIVVSHGIVMRQFEYHTNIPYCGIIEVIFAKILNGAVGLKT
ncbi:histidine phosphatase family protein [Clostridium bowmanii]|uniref:histidine phosphatase family protein n=1 Tax=Clostridium bowmanii TaxID=132925 RepID=UPI001C0BD30E|nr:histidine phosphatase family protein [Clostridium bowmanii]MBU3191832.1 histidine phosphatase family protein [Clostridium bowmanii]MCA1076178.1 histidine phosphatase family protein [Clostridium bowmanii]